MAAILLVVAAGLAVGGSSAETHLYSWTITPLPSAGEAAPAPRETRTVSTTGWAQTYEPPIPAEAGEFAGVAPVNGITLVVAGLVTFLGAMLLLFGRSPVAGKLCAAGGGLVAGAVAIIWTGIAAGIANQVSTPQPGSLARTDTFIPGVGAWLLLVAGALAIVAVAVLIVPGGTARPHPSTPARPLHRT